MVGACGVLLALVVSPAIAGAQPASATPPPLTFKSLGQPLLFKPRVAGSLTCLISVEKEKARKIGRLIWKVL